MSSTILETMQIPMLECEKCDHRWPSRKGTIPEKCPHCQAPSAKIHWVEGKVATFSVPDEDVPLVKALLKLKRGSRKDRIAYRAIYRDLLDKPAPDDED